MIPFASQRGGGRDLATHLLNEYDNDMVEVASVRGAIATDLHGAFKEWQVQAEVLTKCRKYLYSLSINPDPEQGTLTRDQYMDYITRAEDALGLTGQPRAIVFHTKYGREHCHVAWSRIDSGKQRAVHLAFDKEVLMAVTRDFARDHKLRLPPGYEKSTGKKQRTLYEQAQELKTGLTQEDHKRNVTAAWRTSDSARAFVQALAEQGYMLATGKRSYVVVDFYGNSNSLPKLIDDKSVRTADVRAFLENDYPTDSLPTVEEAEKLVARLRDRVENATAKRAAPEQQEVRTGQLQQAQQLRRIATEEKVKALRLKTEGQRREQVLQHRAARDKLRTTHLAKMRAVRMERAAHRPTGLAAFLGRISGVTFLRERRERLEDSRTIKAHKKSVADLTKVQRRERDALNRRLRVQDRAGSRQLRNLESLDRRELSALTREERRERLTIARGPEGVMPSVETEVARTAKPELGSTPDVLTAFEQARHGGSNLPDIARDFERASTPFETRQNGSAGVGSDKGPPSARRFEKLKNQDRDRD